MDENTNLQDDQEQEVIEQQEQEQSTGAQPGSSSQQPNQQEQEEEQEISLDPVEGEEEQEEKPVSRRESKRIQQLLDKFAERDEAAFRGRNNRPQSQPQRRGRQIIPEGEYDIEDINQMAGQYGESEYSRGLSEAQAYTNANSFATRMEIDAPRVNAKYTFLDKESQDFDPGVASLVNRLYLNSVGYDPMTGVVQTKTSVTPTLLKVLWKRWK